MYRNSPVRTQRSKGIKVKNVLQVCLLVAVCFWLIFQVKRSHDKRKEFDASDSKVSLSTLARNSEEIAKLGRKDLIPKFEKTANEGEGDGHEQEEEEEQDDHEENKRDGEEQDEDKIEEEKDDDRDVGIDREEIDVIGEEKETEESDEKENDNENEDVSEEKDGQTQTENEVSSVENNEDGATEHTHEAREENYKADDASSAVTHTGRTLGTETEIKNGTIVVLSETVGQTAENGTSTSPNTTVIQEKDPEPLISDVTPTSIDSNENGPPSDTTLITSQSTETQNITAVTEESSNSTDISNSEVTESNESSSDPSKTELETETNNVTEVTEDPDEVQHDPIDSTDLTHLEEKDIRTDVDTLPDIETEGGNSEDTAAE